MKAAVTCVVAMALLGGARTTRAAEPASDEARAVEQQVRSIALAHELASWARRQRSAHGLLLAARMLAESAARPGDAPGTIAGVDGNDAAPVPPSPAETPDVLLAEARALAAGDRWVISEANAIAAAAPKGVDPGPRKWQAEIPARSVWTLRFNVRGGERLYLTALSDGDAPIELELRDDGDRLVCGGQRGNDVDCRTVPAFNASYVARIFNRGVVTTKTLAISN